MTEEVEAGSRRLAAESDYSLIGISECTLRQMGRANTSNRTRSLLSKLTGRPWGIFVCLFGNRYPHVSTSLIVINLLKLLVLKSVHSFRTNVME